MTDELRDVDERDWPAILALATRSVAHIPEAGAQDQWLDNRRNFDRTRRRQWRYVDTRDGAIVGYGGVETDTRGEYRVFIVCAPSDLGDVGERLYQHALAILAQTDATRVWFTEHAADAPLREFAEARGFCE